MMSHHSRNWFKFVTLVVAVFALTLFFAGLLDFPRTSEAQDRNFTPMRTLPIVEVDAPRIPAARPLADLSEAFSAVAEAVRPSVVFISSERPISRTTPRQIVPPGMEPFFDEPRNTPPGRPGLETSSGSGFVVSSDGYILTNHHVIEGATHVDVRLLDGRVFDAVVVGSDKDTDVGVLKIEATGLRPASLGSSAGVRVGEWVLAIGNPLGADLTFSVTQGIVSAKGRGSLNLDPTERNDAQIQDFIQTDAAINRGNSGGPLVNVRGEVIAINSAIASYTGYYAGYAFAVPIDLARAVMNQIVSKGRVERTAMGVFVRPVSEEDAIYLGLDSIAGVVINNFLDDNSPARRAGIEIGDVILKVDGQPVTYVAQLQQVVGFRNEGETVEVEVVRPTGRRTIDVRLQGVGAANSPERPRAEAPRPVVNPATQNRLGAAFESLTPARAAELQVPGVVRGVLVKELAERSPASGHLCPVEGSVRCYPDVIVAVEGRPVRNEAELRTALATGGRNGVITLTVVNQDNGGQSRVERVRLIDR
jgi:serine protease Do